MRPRTILAALALALLASCQASAPAVATGAVVYERQLSDIGLTVVADPETGCQYLVANNSAMITPRYERGGSNSNGSALTRVRGCR